MSTPTHIDEEPVSWRFYFLLAIYLALIAGLIFVLGRMGLQAALQEIVDENGQAAASNADRGTDKNTPIAKA